MNTAKPNTKKGFFQKADLLIYSILLLLVLTTLGFLPKEKGVYAEIYSDGKLYGVYDLNTNAEMKIEGKEGYNVVVIADSKVWVKEANCPGQDCVRHKEISKANQTIICTPNRLIIIIKGKSDIDAYTGGGL